MQSKRKIIALCKKNDLFNVLKTITMKKNLVLYSTLLIIIISIIAATCIDDDKKSRVLTRNILRTIHGVHYEPKNIDDTFSEQVFDLYLKRLDFGKRYFIQSDIETLKESRHLIDEQLKENSVEFYDLANKLLEERTNLVKKYYKEILDKPFDFDKNEKLETDPDKINYPKDEVDRKESWRKYLKYQTLTRLYVSIDIQEKAQEKNDTSVQIKTFAELEKEAREKVLKSYTEWEKRLIQIRYEYRIALYMNAIANVNDPHTEYFPPREKENFDIQISGRLEGIGATLQSSEGYVKVVRIVPGSASWKQGDLEVGDLIIKVGQGSEAPVDVVDVRLDDAVKIIRGKKGSEVRLTVKKLDGSIHVIPIIRDVVIIEETFAKSAIVTDEKTGAKIGYIVLPKFYVDFHDPNGPNCSRDMKREIENLKKENVDGIIVDLRNNTGGSLTDVVKIAGYFVKEGPMVQVLSRLDAPKVLRDPQKTILWDGPLAVMINTFSASASEIFAAAIQDYRRGIIIGSPSFGKGTVQRFIDLDRFVSASDVDVKPLGALKITMQKFYRIDGHSTQRKGVVPDILIPDRYAYLEVGEKNADYPIKWDEIAKANFDLCENMPTDINSIIRRSSERIEKTEAFKLIEKSAKHLKKMDNKSKLSLNFKKYKKAQTKIKNIAKNFDELKDLKHELVIDALEIKKAEIENDTLKMTRFENWQKEMQKDFYIRETVSVLNDLIK